MVESEERLAAWLGTLSYLHATEITALLNSESNLDHVVNDLYQREDVNEIKQRIVQENLNLATENLARKQIWEDKITYVKGLCDEFRKRFTIVEQNLAKVGVNVDDVSEKLCLLVETSEAESEGLGRLLVQGNIGSDEFVERFLESRSKYHLREIKKEKLKQLLRNRMVNC